MWLCDWSTFLCLPERTRAQPPVPFLDREKHTWRNCSFPQTRFFKLPWPLSGFSRLSREELFFCLKTVDFALFSSVWSHLLSSFQESPQGSSSITHTHTLSMFCCHSSVIWEKVDDLALSFNLFESKLGQHHVGGGESCIQIHFFNYITLIFG